MTRTSVVKNVMDGVPFDFNRHYINRTNDSKKSHKAVMQLAHAEVDKQGKVSRAHRRPSSVTRVSTYVVPAVDPPPNAW